MFRRLLLSLFTPAAAHAQQSYNGHKPAFPWRVAPAVARQTGAFPLKPDSADAALLATLEPGAYSVIISGADNGTGNFLVEIYEVR